ncbi:hypothetical protein [Tenacibaculum ovolyticum]|uniref:hypothetical protein n=1 Tax=Tenacibaculum ovolyticum TaxID=104270 RepID=UPI0007EC6E93|nr:hypothetical protein [Tenacibaculum ovolyticum]
MSNKTEFYKKFKEEFAERPFNQKETIQWLTYNKIIAMSWGYQKPTALDEYGLMFKVNGNHHKGWVLITLAGNDTYTLRFFSTQFNETKDKITEVYCDVLQETVDNAIEKIKEYSQ